MVPGVPSGTMWFVISLDSMLYDVRACLHVCVCVHECDLTEMRKHGANVHVCYIAMVSQSDVYYPLYDIIANTLSTHTAAATTL